MKYIGKSFILIFNFLISYNLQALENELIITVEQTAGRVGFYDADNGVKYGSVQVGFLPHEIILSKDQQTAYVSNFGLQDYDETIGIPGTSISVIDIPTRVEKFRFYTFDPAEQKDFSQIDKAPHGMRLRPPLENQLYVNVEKGDKLLVFDVNTRKIIKKFNVNAGTHNFIFSPDGKIIWLMAGNAGVIQLNADTGKIMGQLKLDTPVRGLSYTPDNRHIMASGSNEIIIFNPEDLTIYRHFSNLGVGQILYSDMTQDKKYIIAPAVWDSQAIIIDTKSGKVIQRIATGLDPVTVKVSLSGNFAYVTNARDSHITQINLKTFTSKNIQTDKGPNGLVVTNFSLPIQHKILTLGVPLPLSGKDSKEGREMMLGYNLWSSSLKQSGGITLKNQGYDINIIYLDTQSNINLVNKYSNDLINKYHVNILLSTYGKNAYNIEKEISLKNHVPIIPYLEKALMKEGSNIASGADIFVTQNNFEKEFQGSYNLKSTSLSASSYEAGIILQQAIILKNNFSYNTLMEALYKYKFHTFLSK